MRQTLYHLLLLCAFAASARGVMVSGGDGTQNVTAPADDFGFANVGRIYSGTFFGSCVYLGSGWVLTAYHLVDGPSGGFDFYSVIFRDTSGANITFEVDPASASRLQNPDNSFTDLALFRLTETPSFLPSVTISANTPAAGSTVYMAGNGFDREPGLTYWDVNTTTEPDTWTERTRLTPLATRSGYEALGTQSIRWGTNTLESSTTDINGGFGVVRSIRTDFDNLSGQAQGVPGDSGGAMFYKNGATWELAGLTHAISGFSGQPANTAVYGNVTYAADLATYRDQILLAAVPEPGTAMALFFGAGCLGLKRLRRRR